MNTLLTDDGAIERVGALEPIRQRGCSARHLACFDDILACFVWLGQR